MAHFICTGRLGSDAETRVTTNGTNVVSFSIADDIGWGDKKRTLWIKCAMFGDRGVKVAPYLTKGSIVQIHGEPEAEAWIKDGKAHCTIKVVVNDVKLFGGPKREDAPVADRGRATAGHSARDSMDDSIPFAPEVR